MREADERGFELRGGEINTFIQHRVKELAVKLSITLVRTIPINHWLAAKETGPHRSNTIRHGRYTGLSRGGGQTFTELAARGFESIVNRLVSQTSQRDQSRRH